jgi:hypothetical protein
MPSFREVSLHDLAAGEEVAQPDLRWRVAGVRGLAIPAERPDQAVRSFFGLASKRELSPVRMP